MAAIPSELLRNARRIVVKVGSSTLTRNGELRIRKFTDLSTQIAKLVRSGRQITLVSSGAIAAGRHRLAWTKPARSIREMQAAAAVGQIRLMELYQRRFDRHGIHVGQVLLTRAGLEDRELFLNARHTLLELLALGVVPIVNENDTVATEEIRFGDNDNLSAQIVNLTSADLLVILTDVDGLYAAPPIKGRPKPALIEIVAEITPEIEAIARGSTSGVGRGGMITKLEAARTAARSGAATVICNGKDNGILERLVAGELHGTIVLPGERLASKKHWLAYTSRTQGELVIDRGASHALVEGGRSLLPSGIVEVRGRFGVGDPVACIGPRGKEIARGLTAYRDEDVARIKGLPTSEIERVLGYSNGEEVIHRDDLVIVAPRVRGDSSPRRPKP